MTLSTDPVDWKLDTDGDLVLTTDLVWTSGAAGVAQGIRIAVQMIRGEWFADLDEGVPYFEREGVTAAEALLGQKFDKLKADRAYRSAILRAPNIASVASLVVGFSARTRKLTATWAAVSAFGDTVTDQIATGN